MTFQFYNCSLAVVFVVVLLGVVLVLVVAVLHKKTLVNSELSLLNSFRNWP